jgi:hypothetical protein
MIIRIEDVAAGYYVQVFHEGKQFQETLPCIDKLCDYMREHDKKNRDGEPPAKIFVLSGTLTEFYDFCRTNHFPCNSPRVKFIYKNQAKCLLAGLSSPTIAYYGSWKDRPDFQEVLDVFATINPKSWLPSKIEEGANV